MADALVVGLAKKVKPKKADAEDAPPDDDEGEGMSLDEAEADAVDEMAGVLGIEGDEDKATFTSALRDFVKACMKRGAGGEY